MVQIQLGPEQPVDPNEDGLGRSTVGWHPGMTEDAAWESGRGIWRLNAGRALNHDEAQIVNPAGRVLAVATITGVSKHGERFALEGELLRGDERVGAPTPTPHRSRCSVAYF
ncbi:MULTISPECIES: hypothetical protein [Streptomyces]|uniref:Uncharacterized protein n=1 Tax=Streptomyces cadmiisoli TaxID=2184053 RepID=A0A2Z4JDT6_9ACTN|nr:MULTISPECIES: hypothetical protein [Streptomyces]AWW43289.1 hypothetical protein DN051_42700 [Streptomyces cadmiisoli]